MPPPKPRSTPLAARPRPALWPLLLGCFCNLSGYFMLMPMLLLRLKDQGVPTWVAGLFAASSWFAVLLIVPLTDRITRRLGQQRTLRISAWVSVGAALGFVVAPASALGLCFFLIMLEGLVSGLRWVVAEAWIAGRAPKGKRGRHVGLFETLVGSSAVVGPLLLVGVGAQGQQALWFVVGLMLLGLLACAGLSEPTQTIAPARGDRANSMINAMRRYPTLLVVGFVGGFFEAGLSMMLPLYGLSMGLGAVGGALLVSVSGLGSTLMMWPTGEAADRMAAHARWGNEFAARAALMRICAVCTLASTGLMPLVADHTWLAAAVAFFWGSVGGGLYTLAMVDMGAREQGSGLVNGTAALVMCYTLGGVLGPLMGSAALQWSPSLGFPLLLVAVSGSGLFALLRPKPPNKHAADNPLALKSPADAGT